MTDAAHQAAATRLRDAARTGHPCPPVRELLPDTAMTTGYAVQSLLKIAFVLAADLDRDDLTEETVRSAVGQAVAALEIVDSRIAGWVITLVDTVADNASSGLYVLGDEPVELGDRDLRDVEMVMIDDTGAEVSSGSGADCMGDPIAALLWLARTAHDVGSPLRAGDVVLSGALGPMVPVTAGATYRAELSGLGTVSATFSHRD